MTSKLVTGECENCESSFEIVFHSEYVADALPSFCPFCGERINDLDESTGSYIDDSSIFGQDEDD